MKSIIALALLFLLSGLVAPAIDKQNPSQLWKTIAPGIEYREFYTSTPNHLYVARMQRSNPQAIIESSLSQGKINGGLETVSQMAARYDEAVNYWDETWGNRNEVTVAINGFFYDVESGIPWSGQVTSSWYVKRFEERQNVSGFVWTLDRQVFIGGCIAHPPKRQLVTLLESGESFKFEGINAVPEKDETILYTSHFDSFTPPREASLEVIVALEKPLSILPAPNMVIGTVEGINSGSGKSPLLFDHIVISADNNSVNEILAKLSVGSKVGISQEIQHFEGDCKTPNIHDWSNAYAAIGAGFLFLRQGKVQAFTDLGAIFRAPRTAVGFDQEYIYFIVVDGRQPFHSRGMSIVELGVFMRTFLGAQWAAALDGGGSATMIVNGELMNNPITETQSQPDLPTSTFQKFRGERAVANGLMMVSVLPMETSTAFRAGDIVQLQASENIPLYAGPGTNYATIGFIHPDLPITILPHKLNGVFAKGRYWWYVLINGLRGWVNQEDLAA